MADTIDTLQIQIEATAKGTSAVFAQLESQLATVQKALDGLNVGKINAARNALNGGLSMSKAEKDISSSVNKIRQSLAGLESYKNAALNGDSSALTSFERRVTSIQSAIDVLGEKMQQAGQAGSVDSSALDGYREELYHVQEVLDSVKSDVAEMPSPNTEPTETAMDRLKAAGERVKQAFITIGDGAKKALTGTVNAFKKMHNAVDKAKDKISSFGNKGFMSVLKYAFGIRSLYVLFRRLRKAVTESFGELQRSGAFFQTTRSNIEALKASLTTLKFQFGAVFEPIFNAVAPALQTLINYLITAMNVLSAFTAKLMGKSTYSKAVANMGSLAKNTGGAAKAQKELNKQLQSFDELNNLTTNNGSGGGGGAGGGGSTAGANYVEESVDSVLGDFGKELADKIREGDWQGVGQAISDKLSEAMESIPWDKIYEKARNFGKGLADFFNGLINPRLFGNIGKTLAGALNTAFEALDSFAKEFDWANLGNSIGTGISEWFKTADFSLYGETIHDWIAGILDAGINLLTSTDWEEIGNKIADFLNGLQIGDIASKIKTFGLTLAGAICEALKSAFQNSTFQGKLAVAIAAVIAGIKLGAISLPATIAVVAAIEIGWKIGNKLYEAATGNEVEGGIIEQITDILDGLTGENKIEFDLGDFIEFTFGESNPWNDFFGKAGDFAYDFKEAWVEAWGDIGEGAYDLNQTLKDSGLGDFIAKESFGNLTITTNIQGAFKSVKDFKSFKKNWSDFKTAFKDVKNKITSDLSGAFSKIVDIDNLKEKWANFKEGWSDVKSTVSSYFGGALSKAVDIDTWKTKWSNLKDAWSDKSATLKSYVGGAIAKITDLDSWKSKINDVKNAWTDKANTLKTSLGGAIKSITDLDTWKTKMSNLRSAWADKAASLKASLGGAISNIGTLDTWKSKMSSLQSSWVGRTATFVLNQTGTAISTLKDKIQEIVGFWKDKTATFKLAFTTTVSDIKSWINNNIITPLNSKIHSVSLLRHVNIPTLKAQGGVTNKATNTIWGESGAEALIPLEHNLKGVRMIASTMLKGMADVSQYRYSASPSSYGFSGGISSYNGGSESALMAEQNRLLAEQNQLLRQIAAKDVSISSGAVFNAVQSESNSYYNRTGNSPFVF